MKRVWSALVAGGPPTRSWLRDTSHTRPHLDRNCANCEDESEA